MASFGPQPVLLLNSRVGEFGRSVHSRAAPLYPQGRPTAAGTTRPALTWPPPIIMPRGQSVVPYADLETLNNRLNAICGERDELRRDVETRDATLVKLKARNVQLYEQNIELRKLKVCVCVCVFVCGVCMSAHCV